MTISRYVPYYRQHDPSFLAEGKANQIDEEENDCPICWEPLKDPVYHENSVKLENKKRIEDDRRNKHPICLSCAKKIAEIALMNHQELFCPTCHDVLDPDSVFTWKDKCIMEVKTLKQDFKFGAMLGASQIFGLVVGTFLCGRIGWLIGKDLGLYSGMLIGAGAGLHLGAYKMIINERNEKKVTLTLAASAGVGLGMMHGLKSVLLSGEAKKEPELTIVILAAIAYGSGGGAIGASLGGFFQRRIAQLYNNHTNQ